MRRCRFCPHSVPVPGTTLRRPLQIYKKYPGFETKVTSFFRNLPWGVPYPPLPSAFFCRLFPYAFSCRLAALSRPPSSVAFPVRFLVSPCRPLPSAVYLIYIYNPRKTRWLCGEFPGVAGGLPAGALAGGNAPRKVSKKNLSLSFRIPDIFYRFVKAAAG